MATLDITGEHITLAQALKAAGFAGSGGQAKHLVREGEVKVNDVVETQPARKLALGDRFQVADEPVWTVGRE